MRAIVDYIDDILNSITMYRLVLYGLAIIATMASLLSFAGLLPYSPAEMAASLFVLVAICWSLNTALAGILKAHTSVESSLITALILFLILEPSIDPKTLIVTALVGAVAVTPKYFFGTWRHVFNPAAIALVSLGVLGQTGAIWWVGSQALLPVVAVVGVLVVRKLRRFQMFGLFVGTVLAVMAVTAFLAGDSIPRVVIEAFVSWPLIFFGAIMLTEPATAPPTHRWQLVYAVIIGVFFSLQFHVGSLYASPELALVIGNVFSYAVGTKRRILLQWKKTTQLAPNLYEFLFTPSLPIRAAAGQYTEWTLTHSGVDNRGTRRYFTLASAPGEKDVRLAVRVNPDMASSYKRALLQLSDGAVIAAGKIQGDFVLPRDTKIKLGWIAGGIGVTPFRSMAQEMVLSDASRDIVLLYASARPDNFVYDDVWSKLKSLRLYKILTDTKAAKAWQGEVGFIDEPMLKRLAPDYLERRWYLSGPDAMVTGYKRMLRQAGVPLRNIVTDYFSGY